MNNREGMETVVHSEGKRDKLDDGVVTPSKTYNVFPLTTVEEKSRSSFHYRCYFDI